MTSPLNNKIFQDADKARTWLETLLWPDGPVCGHCGAIGEATAIPTRAGLYQCNACRKQFTVMVGTVFERSHIPLNKWLMAAFLLCASKKGVSAHQIHRMLGITYKSAWFMCHRLREAMTDYSPGPLGGSGKIVEADETVIGGKERNKRPSKRNPKNIGAVGKQIVFALVERGGQVRTVPVKDVSAKTLGPIIRRQVDRKSRLMTDDAGQYRLIGPEFAGYETVNHGIEEYVRGDAHTNTLEGYFSLFKRGVNGTFHHISEQHLTRYLGEFQFRYNNRASLDIDDSARAARALQGIVGKRLTYRRANEA